MFAQRIKFFLYLAFFSSLAVIAQVVDTAPANSDWEQLAKDAAPLLGGDLGAKTMLIVALVAQGTLLAVRKWVHGKYRLLLIAGITVIGGVVSLMAQGQTWMQALTNSAVLAALQVFGSQAIIQFKKPAQQA